MASTFLIKFKRKSNCIRNYSSILNRLQHPMNTREFSASNICSNEYQSAAFLPKEGVFAPYKNHHVNQFWGYFIPNRELFIASKFVNNIVNGPINRNKFLTLRECMNINCSAKTREFSLNTYSNTCDAVGNCRQSFLLPELFNLDICRGYAKGKDKGGGKGKGKGGKVNITSEELNQVVNEARMMEEFDAVMEELREALMKAVAVRTNISSLEELPVELEGDTYPLNELAQVQRKSPQLVVINCAAFPQATKNVMDAIRDSGMNLNPQQDGTTIAVPLPKVTREHREGLASKAKQLCNKCKEALRSVHSNFIRKAKAKEGKDVSDDLLFKVTQKIKELQDERMKEAEAMLSAKQAELLKS